ncbi:GNAT family N-acetyltransferase [Moraxella bovis]|uniref:N-acetyltransferase n=1 Tax=Moraxella bovis TaxID=476 RepID=A0A1T0A172_MORBO|nr:GNAT family N-acetyltransferase [Moraxella bovis]AWY21549.1 N-acetyltransferase [Moraxella bovis]OOR89494.1 GNAT family N-acetyltransferase [Moraxella bovis]UYZ73186.1 N-acetyltransferase [Moraxella bovis]UYZ75740.1 N-acetyltransferase [Moraxella bovis]UYZ78319.1 N-acetyltransferase [Moraxella bovis]
MTDITHNPATQRFEVTIDGHTGFLSYEVIDDDTLNYNHTIVPKELGGRGLGTALVKHALDYARDNGKKVVPNCSFVASYIDRRDEYQSLLA